MLKKFLLNSLSSFVGTWIALVLFGVAAVMITIGIAARVGTENSVSNSVKSHSILTLDLNGTIVESAEATNPDYLELMQGNLTKPATLNQIVEGIKSASNNDNIDAMYIKCQAMAASPATVNAIREAVKDFKKKGKKVYAYGDSYTLGTYYIASADRKSTRLNSSH